MTTVGVLTFHHSPNYGAVLQTYALCQVISDMGYNVEVIDFRKDFLSSSSWRRRMAHRIWSSIVAKALVGSHRQASTARFREEFVPVSKDTYFQSEELRRHPPSYGAYICGSDQVWNLRLTNSNVSYLLDFVAPDRKRISYAASFGSGDISGDHAAILQRELPKFDAISVRELNGQALLGDLLGVQVDVALDPTLLITSDRWRSLAGDASTRRPYILCYYMPGLRHVTRQVSRAAAELSRLTGFDVLRIGQKEYHRLFPGERNVFDAGPREFLSLFADASFILTNSFHGTAFAVNFGKPFYSFVDGEDLSAVSLSGRLVSLLRQLSLQDRLVWVDSGGARVEQLKTSLDYTDVTPLLQRRRDESLDFLERSLAN